MQVDKEKLIRFAREYFQKNTKISYEQFSIMATEAFTGWSGHDPDIFFGKMRKILDIMDYGIDVIEAFSKDVDSLNSREKLDACVDFLDDAIKFNWAIELIDQLVIKAIISSSVQKNNKVFGKEWSKGI